jgi:hypothetical protein
MFEYLMIQVVQETNWAKIVSIPADKRPAQTFTMNAYISRPGVPEPEKRQVDNKLGTLGILNELGQQGWRLVESTITHTCIFDYSGTNDFYGHKIEIGSPIRTLYTFIREVSA